MTNEARSVPDLCRDCGETERYPGTTIKRHQHVAPFIGSMGDHPFVPASPALPEPPTCRWQDENGRVCARIEVDPVHHGQPTPAVRAHEFRPPAPALHVEGDDSDLERLKRDEVTAHDALFGIIDGLRHDRPFGPDYYHEMIDDVADAREAVTRADERRAAEERIAELTAQKAGAYSERNKTVIALAWVAHRAGCRVGVREHEGEWDDDWRAILMIDLPTGQASWHFHDSERPLLAGFPAYPDAWDGHTTEEKYERLRALSKPTQEAQG